MSKMREQVVSKIRAAAEGLPEVQKRVLADAEAKGDQWTELRELPGIELSPVLTSKPETFKRGNGRFTPQRGRKVREG